MPVLTIAAQDALKYSHAILTNIEPREEEDVAISRASTTPTALWFKVLYDLLSDNIMNNNLHSSGRYVCGDLNPEGLKIFAQMNAFTAERLPNASEKFREGLN